MKAKIDLKFSSYAGHRASAGDMWRDLVAIDNIRLTAKRQTAVHKALLFAEKYGLTECDETRWLVKNLFRLGASIKILVKRDRHPDGRPIDVFGYALAPIGASASDYVEVDTVTRRTAVSVSNLRRCAELSFHLSDTRPTDDCKNCGEVIPRRAGSRFCSDYCRDVSKKKRMRDAAKKEGYHAVEQ
jgi:predicted nucleic acid-binding Zn ribbon protein